MIPKQEIKGRIKKIRKLMDETKIEAMLISKPKNSLYVSGIEFCRLLLTSDSCIIFTNELDYQTVNALGVFDAKVYDKNKKNDVKTCINRLKPKTLGVENIDVNSYEKLKEDIDSKIIISVSDAVETARMVKSDYEIDMLKKSAEIAKKGMEKAYEVISLGISEIDAAAEIEYAIRKNCSETPPFEHGMLLSSGKSAGNIHGFPARKKIKKGEMIIIDLGARYESYYSDMSRTIPAGELKSNSEERKAYEFIKNLHAETTDIIKTGMKVSDIHKFAEEKIKKFGYKFHHSIGHGIGLEIHEMPQFKAETMLSENMVFTIEPGIYVPDKFGVRFEDMVLLTKRGCRILT